jgi:hypothetical protein
VKTTTSKPRAAAAVNPQGAAAGNVAGAVQPTPLTLTLHLAGRICLVESEDGLTAVLLDAERNASLAFRKHRPLLRGFIHNTRQSGADLAFGSFVDRSGFGNLLWEVAGHDMSFEGLSDPAVKPNALVGHVVDLKAAFARVDSTAEWKTAKELIEGDPAELGILARLSLAAFDTIDTMFFERNGRLTDGQVTPQFPEDRHRVFLPGDHEQDIHAIVRCTARFQTFAPSTPTLVLKPHGGGPERRIAFDDGDHLLLTLSNLCNCVSTLNPRTAVVSQTTFVAEDDEFALYYEFLKQPPSVKERPVPFLKEGAGAVSIPECVPLGLVRHSG